ncbi:MAG: hypothetical protein GY827_12225 [Cytophagales bacterium]|nr:hypothetical protein [Cytophagales bacterium]
MKFRRLTDEELTALEKEFVEFLVSNTITADDWEKLKKDDTNSAHELIDLFSDIVLEKALGNIKYLEHREEKSLMLFECGKEQITLIGVNANENVSVDLRNQDSIQSLLNQGIDDNALSIFKTTKAYQQSREEEIFQMTENSCLVSDGALFYSLNKIC